jgi:TonB family protein
VVGALADRMGLRQPVRVLTAALPDGPSVVGWLRPVLLLPPATLLGLTPDQLEAVLAHELAHIRRYDHVVNALQTLVETLLFYHPAVWWISARIREERELCCDDLAVRVCGDPLCFARALTRLERLRVPAASGALAGNGGSLTFRVQRLVGATRQECAPSKLSGILAFALGLASLLLNVHWAKGQDRPSQPDMYAVAGTVNSEYEEAGVTVDLGGATLLHRSSIMYAEAARTNGIEGTVAVQVTLDRDGNVDDARVVNGPMELRKGVMQSIFDWHFARAFGGSTREVKVTFNKAAQDAAYQAQGRDGVRAEPGVLVAVPNSFFSTDTNQNRVLIWNPAVGAASATAKDYPEGLTFRKVEVEGLSDEARRELLSQLPVHAGDIVSEESVKAVQDAVMRFDEHLTCRVELQNEGNQASASIRISAPGHEK